MAKAVIVYFAAEKSHIMATSRGIMRLFKQAYEIVARVENDSRKELEVRRQFQEILDEDQPLVGIRPDQLYASPSRQHKALERWNQQLQLGFTEQALKAAYEAIPESRQPHRPFAPVTLCWTLADVEKTVRAKLEAARLVYGDRREDPYLYDGGRVSLDNRLKRARFKLVDGAAPFVPNNIWWETHQLNGGLKLKPSQVPPNIAAGTQALDIMIQHKTYVSLQDGRRFPYLDAPGLLADVRNSSGSWGPWHFTLFLKGGAEHGGWYDTQLHIATTSFDSDVYEDFAEPIIVS